MKKTILFLIGLIIIFLMVLNIQFYMAERFNNIDLSKKTEQSKEDVDKLKKVTQSVKEKNGNIDNKDFYQITLQAYKDFDVTMFKYFNYALTIISFIMGIVIAVFFFLFRSTIHDIKQDLQNDASKVQDIYSKTFDILNKQAETNYTIFKSRDEELKDKIKEQKEFYEKVAILYSKLSNTKESRENISEELVRDKMDDNERYTDEIKEDFNSLKKQFEETEE